MFTGKEIVVHEGGSLLIMKRSGELLVNLRLLIPANLARMIKKFWLCYDYVFFVAICRNWEHHFHRQLLALLRFNFLS